MLEKLTALVIDDEERSGRLLYKLLKETLMFDDLRLVNTAESALTELNQFSPDMIFLDIKMPGMDGFSFLQRINYSYGKPGVVIVSAYDKYAIKAIKSQVFDYLLKPANHIELKQCVVKYRDSIGSNKNIPLNIAAGFTPGTFKRIMVNTRTGKIFINPATVLYCKADGNYTTIFTGEKQFLCSMNLGRIMEMLPENGFVRLGRSYILNYEHISMLDRKDCTVTLVRLGVSVIVKLPKIHIKELSKL